MFLPQAAVVAYCSRIWPLEGGVYQWTKFAFGPCAAFIGAWNFVIWALIAISNLGLYCASSLAYILGPRYGWMPDSHAFVGLLNFLLFGFILLVNIPGFHIGKWVSHFGAGMTVIIAALLALLIFYHPATSAAHPHVSPQRPISFAFPVTTLMTLMSLNLFSKVCNSALSGLEQVAVFAGETKNPSSSILRSAWIGAPLTALLYILMTCALLVYTPSQQIDLLAPVPQVLAAAFAGGSGAGAWIAALLSKIAIFGLALAVVAQYSVLVAETARLPLVAGWDDLVPKWFTRLHPKYRTPTRSIFVIVVAAVAICMLATWGAGHEEAFQLMNGGANTMYGVYYVMFFAVPVAAVLRSGLRNLPRPGVWLVLASISGMLITVMGMVFALLPIVDVKSKMLFAVKVGVVALVVNAIGALLYWRGSRSSAAA